MKVSLVIESGSGKGEVIALRKAQIIFGKSADTDVRIPSSIVSRRHCSLEITDSAVVLRDLGSKNGTFLNGKKISDAVEVSSGDLIKIGQTTFKAIVETAPEAEIDKVMDEEILEDDRPAAQLAHDLTTDERAYAEEIEKIKHHHRPDDESGEKNEEGDNEKDEIPVAEAIEEEPAEQAVAAELVEEDEGDEVEFNSGFFLNIAECLVSAREAFLEHYRGSSQRARNILKSLVRILGLNSDEAFLLDIAGLLYAAGKLLLPRALLNKTDPLTPEETRILHKYPEAAVSFFRDAHLPGKVVNAILSHRERYDGTGYPKGLRGEEIPKLARVLSIADALSAMTSSRPYRTSLSASQAIDEIEKGAGTQFDPKMARKIADYFRLNMNELRNAAVSNE